MQADFEAMKAKKIIRRAAGMLLLCAMLTSTPAAPDAAAKGENDMNEMAYDALTLLGVPEDERDPDELSDRDARVVELAEEAQACLAKKYPGVSFKLADLLLPDMDQRYAEFRLKTASVEGDVRLRILLYQDQDVHGVEDDYYGYLNTGRYERFLADRFGDLDPGLRVFSTIYCWLDETYDAAFPVEEAADDPAFFAYTWFLLGPSDTPFEQRLEAFRGRVERLNLSGEFTVYALIDPLPAGATKAQVFELIPSHTDARPVYSDSGVIVRRSES